MSIAKFKSNDSRRNRRIEYMDFTPGNHIVRFLSEEAVVHETHFVKQTTIKCLGDECPICQNNRDMIMKHGYEEARIMSGYVPRRQVAYVNVLDRTMVKICPRPDCGKANKKTGNTFSSVCSNPKCNASLEGVKEAPLNQVRVLSKGRQFFEQLEFHVNSQLDPETQTPLNYTTYDYNILVMGGKNTPIPSPLVARNDVVDVPEEDLFDLNKAIITFTHEEINDLLRGVSKADIFNKRKAENSAASPEALDELRSDIGNTIFPH